LPLLARHALEDDHGVRLVGRYELDFLSAVEAHEAAALAAYRRDAEGTTDL
jgi:hypothetical protein